MLRKKRYRWQMKVAETKKLGKLVKQYLISEGAAPIGRPQSIYDIEADLKTNAGTLRVMYNQDGGDIFGRFEDVDRAKECVYAVNPYSGKWNHHHVNNETADVAFAAWKRDLEMVKRFCKRSRTR